MCGGGGIVLENKCIKEGQLLTCYSEGTYLFISHPPSPLHPRCAWLTTQGFIMTVVMHALLHDYNNNNTNHKLKKYLVIFRGIQDLLVETFRTAITIFMHQYKLTLVLHSNKKNVDTHSVLSEKQMARNFTRLGIGMFLSLIGMLCVLITDVIGHVLIENKDNSSSLCMFAIRFDKRHYIVDGEHSVPSHATWNLFFSQKVPHPQPPSPVILKCLVLVCTGLHSFQSIAWNLSIIDNYHSLCVYCSSEPSLYDRTSCWIVFHNYCPLSGI